MPKKKQTLTGFTILMKELQEKHRKEGRIIPLSQMKEIADPFWKRMTEEEKKRYTEKAKLSRRICTTEKLASDGTSIKHNLEQLEQQDLDERRMVLNIRDYIHANEQDMDVFKSVILRQTYFIMSFNILCCTEEEEYYPLEIGIIEYSILKGILREYHRFIYPGRVPTGYMGEAKRISESSHQISYNGHEDSERDYVKLMKEIKSFFCPLGTEEELPPIFSFDADVEQTLGCLQWLIDRSGYKLCGEFGDVPKVWDLTYLLLELRSAVGQPVTLLIARQILSKNTFDYTPGTRCDFHEDLDCKDCARGYVKRLGYLMSDCLCGVFDVEVTEKHLPARSLSVKPYEVQHVVGVSKNSPGRELPPFRSSAKSSTGLDEFEPVDDDVELDYCPSPRMPLSAFSQLKLSASANVPGQGIGRGRPRNA